MVSQSRPISVSYTHLEYVRHQMREFIKQMDANKEVLGNVEFSLALGEEVMEPSLLAKSVQTAEMIICERLVEGCGRMLEVLPAGSSLRIQEVIDKFCKASEHAIDTLSLEEAEQATDCLLYTSFRYMGVYSCTARYGHCAGI